MRLKSWIRRRSSDKESSFLFVSIAYTLNTLAIAGNTSPGGRPPVALQEHIAILPASRPPDNRLFSTTAFQSLADPDSMRLRKSPRSKNLRNRRRCCGTQARRSASVVLVWSGPVIGFPSTSAPVSRHHWLPTPSRCRRCECATARYERALNERLVQLSG
jgi:hypothetical protein